MRVLAVTDDTGAQVVLSVRTSDDLDVVAIRDLDEVGTGDDARFDAVLVRVRDVGRAMSTIVGVRDRVGDLPAILMSTAPPGDLDDSITVLSPTTDIEQLEQAIRAAVVRPPPRDRGPVDDPELAGSPRSRHRARRRGRSRGRLMQLFLRRRSEPQPEPDSESLPDPRSRAAVGPQPTDLPSPEDLRAGLRAANRVQQLVDQVPQLTSRSAVGHLVVDNMWEAFQAEAVVLWAPNGAGSLEAISWRGVSPAVLRHEPSSEQPLLADLLDGTDALAYRWEERFPTYLDGLPGLRGDSLIAAALRVADETHGVVVAAGRDYHEIHAGQLSELVGDYATLLAIAAHLELLRRRRRLDLTTTYHETLSP